MSELWTWVNLCVNLSFVMRYRTARGWLSELTRGHGRNPITETLCVSNSSEMGPLVPSLHGKVEKQCNRCVSDVLRVGASTHVFARLQSIKLLSSLSMGTSTKLQTCFGLIDLARIEQHRWIFERTSYSIVASSLNELPFPTSDTGTSSTLLLC
jgi:hypothetical protein